MKNKTVKIFVILISILVPLGVILVIASLGIFDEEIGRIPQRIMAITGCICFIVGIGITLAFAAYFMASNYKKDAIMFLNVYECKNKLYHQTNFYLSDDLFSNIRRIDTNKTAQKDDEVTVFTIKIGLAFFFFLTLSVVISTLYYKMYIGLIIYAAIIFILGCILLGGYLAHKKKLQKAIYKTKQSFKDAIDDCINDEIVSDVVDYKYINEYAFLEIHDDNKVAFAVITKEKMIIHIFYEKDLSVRDELNRSDALKYMNLEKEFAEFINLSTKFELDSSKMKVREVFNIMKKKIDEK